MRAEQVTEAVAYHGEGPVWSERWGGLRWVDMFAGDVLSLAADGTVAREHVGDLAAAVRPRRGGGAVLGVERGFALQDRDGTVEALPELWDDPNLRMNEGGCDPEGRFYCGSMAYDKQPGAGALYRLDPDGSVTVVLDGLTVSNGLEWSPDGSRAYYNDTDTYRTDVFDYDAESGLTGQAPVRGGTRRCRPSRRADGRRRGRRLGGDQPAAARSTATRPRASSTRWWRSRRGQVTACTFGGPELDQLFITTSRENLEPGDDPLAGSVVPRGSRHPRAAGREFAG